MPDWNREVLPVLQAVHRAIQRDSAVGMAGYFSTETSTVNDELGRDENDSRTGAILFELRDKGFIKAEFTMGSPPMAHLIQLTEKGSQHVAGWPARPGDDSYPALIAALDDRIAAADDEERTRLEKLRDGVLAVGQGVITGVLTDMARRGL